MLLERELDLLHLAGELADARQREQALVRGHELHAELGVAQVFLGEAELEQEWVVALPSHAGSFTYPASTIVSTVSPPPVHSSWIPSSLSNSVKATW